MPILPHHFGMRLSVETGASHKEENPHRLRVISEHPDLLQRRSQRSG